MPSLLKLITATHQNPILVSWPSLDVRFDLVLSGLFLTVVFPVQDTRNCFWSYMSFMVRVMITGFYACTCWFCLKLSSHMVSWLVGISSSFKSKCILRTAFSGHVFIFFGHYHVYLAPCLLPALGCNLHENMDIARSLQCLTIC